MIRFYFGGLAAGHYYGDARSANILYLDNHDPEYLRRIGRDGNSILIIGPLRAQRAIGSDD